MINLVLTSSTSRDITGLWVGDTLLSLGLLGKHKGVGNVSTLWILVEGFTREDSGGIRGVSSEGLERVEVHGGTRGSGVPGSVDVLLSIVGPQLIVVLSEGNVDTGTSAYSELGRCECRSRSNEGEKCKSLGVLMVIKKLDC